jgi:hypothetical protein
MSAARQPFRRRLGTAAIALTLSLPIALADDAARIGGHIAQRDRAHRLQPWAPWAETLAREMERYRDCPADHGYPRFVSATFLDGRCEPSQKRLDSIPSTQDGFGIISYLKYYQLNGRREPQILATARAMGDYLVREALTPDSGPYPHFPRSTGHANAFPQPADSGSQSDRPYEIEPDKGGIAGYALLQLFDATHEPAYRDLALHIARVLVANQLPGDAAHSPWPFRADLRDGAARGPISSNMTYILRLYDSLLAAGYGEFARPRRALWQWIKEFQIPSAAGEGVLFAQFFEDHDSNSNRNAWAPLNLARYLLEKRDALDANWRADTGTLIDFVRRNFTHQEFGVTVCHEQDEDKEAWGGVNSTYGAVLALYARATNSATLAADAREVLNFVLYAVDQDGRAGDLIRNHGAGGWQEDAHTDVIHNYVDALRAYPEWGAAR